VLVLSRASVRTTGGVLELLDHVPVREVWVPDVASRSPAYVALLEQVAQRGIAIRRLARGDQGYVAGGVFWEVLQPARAGTYRTADDAALVLRLARGPSSVLYVGSDDAEREGELLEQPISVGASGLILGAQELASAGTAAWLAAVQPAHIVRPFPAELAADPAALEQRERLEAAGVTVWDAADGLVVRLAFARWPGASDDPLVRASSRERER